MITATVDSAEVLKRNKGEKDVIKENERQHGRQDCIGRGLYTMLTQR